MSVLPACPTLCQKRASDPTTCLSHHVIAGNWTQDLKEQPVLSNADHFSSHYQLIHMIQLMFSSFGDNYDKWILVAVSEKHMSIFSTTKNWSNQTPNLSKFTKEKICGRVLGVSDSPPSDEILNCQTPVALPLWKSCWHWSLSESATFASSLSSFI